MNSKAPSWLVIWFIVVTGLIALNVLFLNINIVLGWLR